MNGQQELNDALQRVVRPSHNYFTYILFWSKKWIKDFSPTGQFTTESFRKEFESLMPYSTPAEPRVYGAVIKALQSEGKIRHVGYTKATNKQAHCRPISVWEVV